MDPDLLSSVFNSWYPELSRLIIMLNHYSKLCDTSPYRGCDISCHARWLRMTTCLWFLNALQNRENYAWNEKRSIGHNILHQEFSLTHHRPQATDSHPWLQGQITSTWSSTAVMMGCIIISPAYQYEVKQLRGTQMCIVCCIWHYLHLPVKSFKQLP